MNILIKGIFNPFLTIKKLAWYGLGKGGLERGAIRERVWILPNKIAPTNYSS